MKIFQLGLLSLLFFAKSYGQVVSKNHYGRLEVHITKQRKAKPIYVKVEILSAFPGADSAWVTFIENSMKKSIATAKRIKKGTYIFSVKFIVSKDGSISDIFCENNPVDELCSSVIRALFIGPKWVPAPQPVEVKPLRS